jgi:hypothetical protein
MGHQGREESLRWTSEMYEGGPQPDCLSRFQVDSVWTPVLVESLEWTRIYNVSVYSLQTVLYHSTED